MCVFQQALASHFTLPASACLTHSAHRPLLPLAIKLKFCTMPCCRFSPADLSSLTQIYLPVLQQKLCDVIKTSCAQSCCGSNSVLPAADVCFACQTYTLTTHIPECNG